MAYQRKRGNMQETICRRCGEIYDARFKRCPKCNEPNSIAFVVFKIIGITLLTTMITTSFVLSLMTYQKVKEIEETLINLEVTNDNYYSQKGTDLKQYDFYAPNEISGEALPSDKHFLLYFHQDDCPYCMETNEYIVMYFATGDENKENLVSESIPIYFITPESSSSLFDNFAIESTPTLLELEDGEVKSMAQGSDESIAMLKNIVLNFYEG